jgi:predicted aspartyl protease
MIASMRVGRSLLLALASCLAVLHVAADGPATPTLSTTDIADLQKRADAGDANAQQSLGMTYFLGNGVNKDTLQAFTWCMKSAEQGNLQAENNVAYMYHVGEGVTQNDVLCLQWKLKVAQQGVPESEATVGDCFYHGTGTARDILQAIFWYRKAAVQGDNEAKIKLGTIYLQGDGVPVDAKKGFTYLLNASAENAYASFMVACCYRDGTFVQADPVQAYMWGLYADKLESKEQGTDFLTSMRAKMTPEQIQQAEKDFQDLPRFMNADFQPADLSSSFAQGTSSLIPCECLLNGILLPVQTADKSTALLMVDTGADECMLSAAFASKLGLHGNTYLPATGIGEEVMLSTISDRSTLSVPGLTFHNARWAILPNMVFDAEFGRPVVGILGMPLLKDLVVRIDYVHQTMEFIKPEKFQPPAGLAGLPITIGTHRPFVEATVRGDHGTAKAPFLVDTGDNGSFGLTKLFQRNHPDLTFRQISQSGASGIGGVLYVSEGICPSLDLDGNTLPDVLVDMDRAVQGAETDVNGTIGNEVWRRFDVTFDFPHNKMYLQKNAHFSDPFSYVSAGMHVLASGDQYQTLTVHEVLPGSASEQAGFKSGDILVKMEELGSKPLTMANVYPLIHQPGTSHFTVKRGAPLVSLTLEIKPVTPGPTPSTVK